MKKPASAKRRPAGRVRACLGPVADLECHLPQEWWRELFNSLYLMTDGDVVENDLNTQREVDALIEATGLSPADRVLDLCCGQGRHVIELARRGFGHVTGIDRSRYLVRLARRRAQEANVSATFLEGDARRMRLPEASQDCVTILGNSFGYFATEEEDAKVLEVVARTLSLGRHAGARHYRRRVAAGAFREALLGVDRPEPLRLPRALAVQRRHAPDHARGRGP